MQKVLLMDPSLVAAHWDELSEELGKIPTLDGGHWSAESRNATLANILAGRTILWVVANDDGDLLMAVLGSPVFLTLDSKTVFYISGLVSHMQFSSEVYNELFRNIALYAKRNGYVAIVADVLDDEYAERLRTVGWNVAKTNKVWRTL